jgi:hypothetical protein
MTDEAQRRPAKPVDRLHSKNPIDAAWRRQQAEVDSDIEGLHRDPEAHRMAAEMDAAGIEHREQRKRLIRYFKARQAEIDRALKRSRKA